MHTNLAKEYLSKYFIFSRSKMTLHIPQAPLFSQDFIPIWDAWGYFKDFMISWEILSVEKYMNFIFLHLNKHLISFSINFLRSPVSWASHCCALRARHKNRHPLSAIAYALSPHLNVCVSVKDQGRKTSYNQRANWHKFHDEIIHRSGGQMKTTSKEWWNQQRLATMERIYLT